MTADEVFNADMPLKEKLIKLWEISQQSYRLEEGEKAWGYIRELAGPNVSNAWAMTTGMALGSAFQNKTNWVPYILGGLLGLIFLAVTKGD